MDSSILLARLLGPMFALVSLGMLLHTSWYQDMALQFIKTPALYYFSGVFALVAGLVILTFHNIWIFDWRIAITIVGWLALFKGAVRVIAPTAGMTLAALVIKAQTGLRITAVLMLIFGLWLSLKGFSLL